MKERILTITFMLLLIPGSALALKVGVYDNPQWFLWKMERLRDFSSIYLNILQTKRVGKSSMIMIVFQTCLKSLKGGELDLVVDVAYTDERAEKFSFNKEVVFTNWGVAVGKKKIDSILELDSLKVAGVKKDVYTEELKNLVEGFDVNCQVIEIQGDYRNVVEEIVAGRADAGVVSRIYASLYAKNYGLMESSLIFGPVELKFAGKDELCLEGSIFTFQP